MNHLRRATMAIVAATVWSTTAAGDDTALTADEWMRAAHLNLYYAANDGRAVVDMTLTNKKGKTRNRRFVMFRLDIEDGGEQKYFTYFLEPSDVRRTAFMVWKDPAEDDARWIFVPAVDLVRRISANDKASSFVGSDFTYEDVSGRHWSDDEHTLSGEDTVNERPTVVVESVPIDDTRSFHKKRTWIDVEWTLPVREEYFDKKGTLVRVFEALGVEEIEGIPTVTSRRMTNVAKEHRTDVVFSDVTYDVGVEASLFTERYLRSPPASMVSGPR